MPFSLSAAFGSQNSLLFFGLTLISAFCWAIFDLGRKKLAQNFHYLDLVIVLMLGQLPLYGLFIFLGPDQFFIAQHYFFLGSVCGLLNILANILFMVSLAWAPLSHTIPLLSFTPVFTSLASQVFLKESLTGYQWIGVTTVFIGLLGLNFKLGIQSFLHTANRKIFWALLSMFGVAILWSITTVLDKHLLQTASLGYHLFWQTFFVFGGSLLLRFKWNRKKLKWQFLKNYWYYLCLMSVALAFGLQLYVIVHMHPGIFETFKRAFGMVLALLFGFYFFKEKITFAKVFWIALANLGLFWVLAEK